MIHFCEIPLSAKIRASLRCNFPSRNERMIFQSPSAACVNLPPSLADFVSQPFGVDAICPTTRRTSDAEKLRHCHAFGAAGLFPFFRVTEPGRASIAVKSGFNRCLRARLTSASGMSRMLGGGADSTCLGSEGGREHMKCSPGTTRVGRNKTTAGFS